MKIQNIDKLFEKMSRECANKMNGTRPPKPKANPKKVTTSSSKKR